MIQDCTWAIGGEAGFGIMSAGSMLAKMFSRVHYGVVASNEYPSLIRGGHNFVSVRIATRKINAPKTAIDILVALNKETVEYHKDHVSEDAMIIYDPKDYEWKQEEFTRNPTLVGIPLSELVRELQGEPVMRNTIALGATVALLGKEFSLLSDMLREQFSKKGETVISENIKIAERGFTFVKEKYAAVDSHKLEVDTIKDPQMVVNASEAVGLGAIAGGMKFAAIYPMTPINALITFFADHTKELGIVYKQPEDELAGINMAIGSSLAGARSMVATSGGGFALMEEGVSLAGIMEIPVVINLGMRPGPATGMPTWTEQGELWMAIHAGHGEFPRIVLAPGDAEDSFTLTRKAFDLAEEYQIPVFILTDKYLNETQWQLPVGVVEGIDKKLVNTSAAHEYIASHQPFQRYDTSTENGVSLRSLPGMANGEYIANSYEHGEDGFTTEDAVMRKTMVDKRQRKMAAIQRVAPKPMIFGEEDADITFVCFGSLKGVVREAIVDFEKKGVRAKCMFFGWVYPLSQDLGTILSKEKRIVCIEQNATGQLASVIREQTGFTISEKWLKYDGCEWTSEEIIKKLTN